MYDYLSNYHPINYYPDNYWPSYIVVVLPTASSAVRVFSTGGWDKKNKTKREIPKGVYQFKVTGRIKHGDSYIAGHAYHVMKEPEPPPPAMWDGKAIGSVEEWRWILASLYYQVEFEYQLPIAGGRDVAGGLVLDFMMFTKPLWTPVSIKGEYWHSGRTEYEDMIREAKVSELYKGKVVPVVGIYTDELQDLEATKEVFRRTISL